ncbi:MAG: penicillin-binding protein activator LpoB [Deltaproteobacteria bacterium]|nr:penicillin-binding protein activator LpoB [Deltaproteobacteria bacterium]
MRFGAIFVVSLMSLSLIGTTGCGPKRKVARVATNTQTDLSGKWNDTDARLTSEAMIKDCFARPWLKRFTKENDRPPKMRVWKIINKTDEHIDAQVFIKNLERAMVNSGLVDVIAQKGSELSSVNEEQDYGASGRVSDDSAPSIGNQLGADFVLVGRMASILDQVEGTQAKLYKITLELIDANSARKVWMGDHEIKKVIEQSSASW